MWALLGGSVVGVSIWRVGGGGGGPVRLVSDFMIKRGPSAKRRNISPTHTKMRQHKGAQLQYQEDQASYGEKVSMVLRNAQARPVALVCEFLR